MTERLRNEIAIHLLQKKIVEKIEFQTNYGNQQTQIRFLINKLKFYENVKIAPDKISFDDFLHFFLQRMNFISLNTELSYLFYHYDDEMTGYLDYRNFVYQLYGAVNPSLPILTTEAIQILENIRNTFLSTNKKEQHNFMRFLIRIRVNLRTNEDGFVGLQHAVDSIFTIMAKTGKSSSKIISKKELMSVLTFFDTLKNNTIHLPTFLRYLKSVISFYRKRLIYTVYQMLGESHHGYVSVKAIKQCYHILPSKVIKFRGKTFDRASLEELMECFFDTEATQVSDNDQVTFGMFLDYYQCISLVIENEEHFELVIRHSWSISDGLLNGRPMANDAEEEVFERPTSPSYDAVALFDPSLTSSVTGTLAMNPSFGSLTRNSPPSIIIDSPSSPLDSRRVPGSPSTYARVPMKTIYRRVLVTHSDLSEESIKIIDELGKTKLDDESIRKQLESMGIRDIKTVRI